jgi:hypothetical protein
MQQVDNLKAIAFVIVGLASIVAVWLFGIAANGFIWAG